MIRTIITYPDKQLKQLSNPVEQFDETLHELLDDMFETMLSSNGIGLAAIQIAVPLRVLVLCLPDEEGNQYPDQRIEIINPTIINPQGTTIYQEGCLSVPSFYEDVERFETLTLSFYDRHGSMQQIEATDLLSIAIQHEIDHLDGKLFIEKLSYSKRKKFEKEYKKMQKEKKQTKAS